MNIAFLTRRELELINRRELRYPLAIAEKDYFLAIVSKIIYDSPLRHKLVFKGGTALHHCYLQQMRFSEDLDFTSLDQNITVEDVRQAFAPYDFLTIKKEYVSPATIKIERLTYNGPLGQANSLKVEIDYRQNVVLPVKDLEYKNVWRVATKVRTMDIREIAAEKIRAMSDRARYRDFYDLRQIFQNFSLDLPEVIGLVKQKEMRQPISQASILANWAVAKQEQIRVGQNIYYSAATDDAAIAHMIRRLEKINL